MKHMMFWIVSVAITLAVSGLLIGALRAARLRDVTAAHSDIAVYKDQLAEVERDLARGIVTESEADAVRVEVSRRLLEADTRNTEDTADQKGQSGVGIAIVALCVVAGGLGTYAWLGAPGYGDMPMKTRLAALEEARAERPRQTAAEAEMRDDLPRLGAPDPEFLTLMEQLREAVAERPGDIQGLTFLAQYEARLGNYAAARIAQEQLIAAKGDAATDTDRLTLVDIMVFAAGGYVSPEAENVVHEVLRTSPENGAARYYLGLTEAQAGRADRAFTIWAQLLEDSPPSAPWVPVVRAEIFDVAFAAGVTNYELPATSSLPALSDDDIAAANDMTPQERAEMIQGMVGRLADRLAIEGGPPEDWARLISTLGVLGDTNRAQAIAAEAETVFAGNDGALALIANARAQAGIGE
ncbi:MAG: c-type cytochrome biogenesis protein CcmI [Boseongicola sp.]|nr:c-type cytochrome biogenesis protein CcmI [Boseongicola sp.]